MIITGQIDISLVLSFYIDVVVIWHFVHFVHLIPNLEHLYIIEFLMHAYATIMFKGSRCSLKS